MQIITAPISAAVMIMAFAVVVVVLIGAALCLMALRKDVPFRFEFYAPSFGLHVSTKHRPRQRPTPDHNAAGGHRSLWERAKNQARLRRKRRRSG
jgi:hypothetical protein